jgi:hypothetical protein
LNLNEIHLAFGVALLGNLDEVRPHVDAFQLRFGIGPELVEVVLLIRRRDNLGGVDSEDEVLGGLLVYEAGRLIETGLHVFLGGEGDVDGVVRRDFHGLLDGRQRSSFVER